MGYFCPVFNGFCALCMSTGGFDGYDMVLGQGDQELR